MIYRNADDNIQRTKTFSISKFKNFARVTATIGIIAISHPSQGSGLLSSITKTLPQALASQVSQKQNTHAYAEMAISPEAGNTPRLHETESKPDFVVPDTTEKRALVENSTPVAIADVMELKRSSNAFNVLINDSDPDGDRLILTDALAQFGAVAFTPEGLIGYAQNPGPPRADIITYTISDNKGNFAHGTVEIIVQ